MIDGRVAAPPFAGFRDVRLQQDSRLQQAPRQVVPFPDKCLMERMFAAARPHDVFLYGNFLRSHDRFRRLGRAESYSSNPFNFVEAGH
jgi:hypothetical protein